MQSYARIYVDGRWTEPRSAATTAVVNPATEEEIATVPECGTADVDVAVRAAAAAQPGWSAVSPDKRAQYVAAIGDALAVRADELTETITAELGAPTAFSRQVQVEAAISKFTGMPEVVSELRFEEQVGRGVVLREGVGVVAAITPWNYPLLQIADKVAPALAAGCTVVLKPSEVTPMNAFILAEAVDAAGLPAGVFNLVSGLGPVAGEALVAHPLVDMVSFTGSTRAGRRISELAAATVKATAMELGGKSPNVILDDVTGERLREVVTSGVASCYPNSGQTCSALTRMIVPRERLAEVERYAADAAATFTVGDPLDRATRLGPLSSRVQLERVREYIAAGVADGARLVTGGAEAPAGLDRGYYVRPTVFSDVRPDMRIAQEEIFGPVLSIIAYDSEEEAIEIANGTPYGLAGGVWAHDAERARRVALQIRSGIVHVNGGREPSGAPFGGFKQSGHGRESGRFGVEEFLTTKTLCL